MSALVDFIPPRRRQLRRVRARGRAWAVACAALAVVLGATYAVLLARGRAREDGVTEELARVRSALDKETRDRAELDAQIVHREAELARIKDIGAHADWSVLLALLARERDGQVVLERVSLRGVDRNEKPAPKANEAPPASGSPSAAAPARGKAFVIRLAGQSRTQGDAAKYALRLEGLGLFDAVRTLETKPVNVLGREYVAFQIECAIGPRTAPAGAQAGAGEGGKGGEP